ncbi:MAG TPA: hypothetical protein O0X39_08400, partial [Methanocorpusculum sp.]|nr:hypothetical protein [Methanocorpusculum sp.]
YATKAKRAQAKAAHTAKCRKENGAQPYISPVSHKPPYANKAKRRQGADRTERSELRRQTICGLNKVCGLNKARLYHTEICVI